MTTDQETMLRRECPCSLSFVLLAALLAFGCSSMRGGKSASSPAEDLRTAIEKEVFDEGRRKELLALADQFVELLEQRVQELQGGRQTLEGIISDYGASRESFDNFFDAYETRRRETGERALEIHSGMKELTTAEEWSSLEKTAQKVTTAMLEQTLRAARGP